MEKDPHAFLPLPSATLHILVALTGGEKHGYAIMGDVEALSDGAVRMGPGTLYGSIKRLLADGLIEESDERPDADLDDQRLLPAHRPGGAGVRRRAPAPARPDPPGRVPGVGPAVHPPPGRGLTMAPALAFVVLGATAVSIGLGAGAVPVIAVAVVAVLVSQRRLFVGSSLLLAFGGAMWLGLMRRPFARTPGNAAILLTTIPAMALFWLIVPPLAAIATWVGVLAGGFEEPAIV